MKKIVLTALFIIPLLACKPAAPTKPLGQGAPKPPKKNPVVVMVDQEKVVKEAKVSQEIQAELSALSENMRREIQGKAEILKQKDSEFRAQAPRLSADQRAARIHELESMQQELQQLQSQAQQELDRRRNLAGQKMTETFQPLVSQLARENGWDVVLNKSEQFTIFSDEAMDQTDYVIQRLNAAPQEKPGAGTPPGGPAPSSQVPQLPGAGK
jgi:outer membrane protein